jgi:16S rRNA (adenine1518-N6/adenine1519-N6)-dimethyltransferase
MNLPSTSQLVKKYGLDAKKSLGQNFIFDKNFTDKIVATCGDLSNSTVLEIGAGPGSLTRSILDANVKKLVVIEKDRRCLKILEEIKNYYGNRLEIINDDAIKIDEKKLFTNQGKIKIISNLPYNIGTVLLIKWLKISEIIESLTIMLQKEVVERIVAKPNQKKYGRLSVMIGSICESKMLFSVNPSIFTPPPKVDSAIVEIIPYDHKKFEIDFFAFEKVVACAFNQRRKMIKSCLKQILKEAEKKLIEIKINPNLRAENLTIEDFYKITKIFLKENE